MILAVFSLASLVNGMAWVVTSAIVVPIAQAYHQSETTVNLIPSLYLTLYVVGNFPSNKVVQIYGLRAVMMIGGLLTLLGCLLRCLINLKFEFIIVGQVFCAAAQPFFLSSITATSVRWFLVKEV